MNSNELFEKIKHGARAIAAMDEFGALHIFVSDGNCEDEDLEFCLQDERITLLERTFATLMLTRFSEDERVAAYAFSGCEDIRRSSEPVSAERAVEDLLAYCRNH